MHKKAQQTHSNQMNKNNLPEEEESAALKLGLEDKVAVLKWGSLCPQQLLTLSPHNKQFPNSHEKLLS